MVTESWCVQGTQVPEGDEIEMWVGGGLLHAGPVPGAEPLPGRFVLAGMVDAHVHLALDQAGLGAPLGDPRLVHANLALALGAGILLARDVGAPVGVRTGGDHADGPLVLAAGRFLAPGGGYLPDLYEPVPPEALIEVALGELRDGWVKVVLDFPEHFTGPASFLEATPNYDDDRLSALCAAVHEAGGRVAAHVSGPGDAGRAVAVGVDSLEHGTDVSEADVVALGRRGGAWTPTLTTVLGMLHGHPWADEHRARLHHLLPLALASGVTVLAGTDATPAGSLAAEVAALASAGLTPTEALAAASSAARRYLGRPGLVVGGAADVVTYHDDPRDDPAVLASPAAVLRHGRRVR